MGKCISILGSTGSIGTQSLEVAKAHDMQVHALAANRNITLLEQQTREYHPKKVCIFEESQYQELKQRLADLPVQVLCGMDGLCDHTDRYFCRHGRCPGKQGNTGCRRFTGHGTSCPEGCAYLSRGQRTLRHLPVPARKSPGTAEQDHSDCIRRAVLRKDSCGTGKFHCCRWSMGNKITIDSATLMNKGLEFIEAKWLFDLTPDQIEIVVHRQSVVHSAVEYQDCSVIAQLGVPDMKIPIQYALLYPERMPCPTKHLSLTDYGTLTFEKPDMETFTCLKTAIAAITAGGTAPCIVNGANEVAVAAFLAGKIGFLEIGALAQQAMESIPATVIKTYEDVMKADTQAREFVRNAIA